MLKVKKANRIFCLSLIFSKGRINKKGYLYITGTKEELILKSKLLRLNKIKSKVTDNYLKTNNYKFLKLYYKILFIPIKQFSNKKIISKFTKECFLYWLFFNSKFNGKRLEFYTGFEKEFNNWLLLLIKEKTNYSFYQLKTKNNKTKLVCGKLQYNVIKNEMYNLFEINKLEAPSSF